MSFNINIKIGRKENADHYGCGIGDTISIPFEEYVRCVVGSEIGNAPVEACKAMAIAARTYAYKYAQSGKAISDQSSTAQAFRSSRLNESAYPNPAKATEQTKGKI